jgi:hypothetical protein
MPLPATDPDKIDRSPDGTRIGFSSPEFGRPGISSNVFTIRPDGRGVVTHGREAHHAAWGR